MAITLRLPPNEDKLLADYAKSMGRTKSDVLREFVRSLPSPAPVEPELPEGWSRIDPEDGDKIEGKYRDVRVEMYPELDDKYFEVYLDGKYDRYFKATDALDAIEEIQRKIDKLLAV